MTTSEILAEIRNLLNRLEDAICEERAKACGEAYKRGIKEAKEGNS